MCYRATQTNKAYEYADYYSAPIARLEEIEQQQIYYHADGFTHPKLVAISMNEGKRQTSLMQWGLIPNWGKPYDVALKASSNTLNAVSEEIWEKASYKNVIKDKRCIIPVNSFFEYKEVVIGKKKDKEPYLIHPTKQPYFNFAATYSNYKNPETGEWLTTFSILTEPANVFMASIHNNKKRMPLMLSNEMIDDWINKDTPISIINDIMAYACDDTELAAYRVDRNLIKIGNNPEALIEVPETTLF